VTFVEQYSTALTSTGVAVLVISFVLSIVFRRRLFSLFSLSKKVSGPGVSLDDIPLDELEMPWHKWDKR